MNLFAFPEPKTESQNQYVKSIQKNIITVCTGKPGTGKTFLAVAEAIKLINNKKSKYKNLIIIRPYIPTNLGERLGALPGSLDEKVAPYAASIQDNLKQMIKNPLTVKDYMDNYIEFAVLSTCRGRSFNNSIVLVEEAQNIPFDGDALKMLLTRIGQNSKMILAGDIDQADIKSTRSSLPMALNLLSGIKGVGIVEMNEYEDIQRDPIVREILKRFEEWNGEKNNY